MSMSEPGRNPRSSGQQRGGSIRIGDLLIRAGILDPTAFDEAIQTATQIGLPFGRVLIMSNFVEEDTLKAALQIQSMINDKLLPLDAGVTALTHVKRERVTLENALGQVGYKKQGNRPTNKLGELLLDSGIITSDQLNQSLTRSYETGLPMGRILIQLGILSQSVLASALNTQVLIRDGKITKDQGIASLKASYDRQVSIEQSLVEQGLIKQPNQKTVRVGELLVMSRLLSEQDLLTALELGLVKEKLIGQILVDDGFIPKEALDAALKLQQLVADDKISGLQAADALRVVHSRHISVEQAIRELTGKHTEDQKTPTLAELLKMCGFVTEKEIQEATERALQSPKITTQLFLSAGVLDEAILNAALRCHYLLDKKALQLDQAIIAMNYCQRSRISFDDTLEEFGWLPPPELRQ
ncbi:MAG: hypothetical protein K2X29_10295 [Candidatus Obscuribacterales bacterium]|nr:hypothetical protein [Candidatus Obscuribacterales bacterium]